MTELVTLQVALEPIAANTQWATQYVNLENYIDVDLPNPCKIRRLTMWLDGWEAMTEATRGNIAVAVDVGKKYRYALENSPEGTFAQPHHIKTLGILELFPNSSRQHVENYPVPICYRPGQDGLIIAPELGGQGVVASPILAVQYESETGDIPDADPASIIFNCPSTQGGGPGAAYSIRNLIPAPSIPFSQIRVRITSVGQPPQGQFKIDHMSVGARSGSSSSTIAPPVPLTINGKGGQQFYLGQWIWSDWIPFNGVAGQDLLITTDITVPTNGFGSWPYSASNGKGDWIAPSPSWNLQNLPAGSTFQANRTHVIERVQVR